ncbi:MAG: NAD(P)/FAD-dependent oxidoreductase [Myxococcales bacterium]|nr:NAD(P)/FAD-dependent oxidoreductase [Myxococcales bacterium]
MVELEVVIVGAGFSGLCAGAKLKEAGIEDFVILEKAHGVGGTWRDNTYPGAACDIPSHLYSYSFEPNPRWSRAYGGQPEILAYLEHCATKFGLRPHLRFGAQVTGATFDDTTGTWTISTKDGETFVARSLVLGNGALHLPAIPELPGASTFAGTTFHSARWNHQHDLRGKKVAVIGTGASTIQFVPQIAPEVEQLHVFQRTPPWIVPKSDRPIGLRERWLLEHVPGAHWLRRTGLYWLFESRVLGFAFAPKVNQLAERLVLKHLAAQVADPELRAQLTPAYRMGCKRVLISNDYYPALCRDNVDLVTCGIAAIEPTGIRTTDGVLHEADTIIYGTGFRVVDYVASMKIVGAQGRELSDVWATEAVRNYLGINVSGFPNLFLLMGPNTGLGHNSMVFMIEAQTTYIVEAIRALRTQELASLDVRPEVEQAFRAELEHKLAGTVWTSGCNSWYQAPDGGVLLWPGFTFDYWRRTRHIDLRNYRIQARTLGPHPSPKKRSAPVVSVRSRVRLRSSLA